MKVDLSCPIELWEYALPTVENPAMSFAFFNLGQRTISSIQIAITCFDANDAVLSRRVERPMALDAKGREMFHITVPAEGQPVESIDLAIEKAWYEDGSEWRRQQDIRLVDYQPNELPPNRKLEELRYIAGSDAVGFPSDQDNVWICICGRVNAPEEERCRRCDRDKEMVFARYAPEAVQEAIDARERELEDKARMAREEASRQEFLRQEKARRKKRARRTRTIVISAVLAVAVLSFLFVVLGLPELRYQTATAAMASGDLISARDGFEALEGYRDAAQMVYECDLRLADEYAHSGDMEKIDLALLMLQDLSDFPGAPEMVRETTYQKGLLYLDRKEYQQASDVFALIPTYLDAQTLGNQAQYQMASLDMNAGKYEAASERFQALGNYLDAAAMANECVYRPAMERMNSGEFDVAAEMFARIPGYSDANDQRLSALYKDALKAQLEGNHEYATKRFEMLGEYEDAPEQVKHSIYLAANTARDTGEYDRAIRLYANIPEYQDAAEQVKACTYLPAKDLMTEGRYEEAAQLFAQIPGYLDADELYNQSLYIPAKMAADEQNYAQAIRLYKQIPEYSDVAKLLRQAEYKQAEKLESEGDLEGAIAGFAALGEYTDAVEREKGARYLLAEAAFEAGDFQLAMDRFDALARYSDAQTRVKECAYEMAMMLYNQGDYQGAYDGFAAIEDYNPAKEKARESAYLLGEKLAAEEQLEEAAVAFGNAGRYEDAEQRQKDSVYQLAQNLKEEGDFEKAGALFDSIAGYTDAREQRDQCYDLWLSELTEQATAFYQAEDYQGVVDLLRDRGLDMDKLPKAYAGIATMYQDANLKIARRLIAEDRALEAYGYLLASKGYRNADTLLEKNIFRILGTWEAEDGTRYAFYLNGTANLAGETVYFNMLSNNQYGIFTGESYRIEEMERTYSYSSGNDKLLRINDERSGKTLVLTRVKAPEVSATSDSEGSMVVQEELEPQSVPVVIDEVTLGVDEIAGGEDETPEDEMPEADETE